MQKLNNPQRLKEKQSPFFWFKERWGEKIIEYPVSKREEGAAAICRLQEAQATGGGERGRREGSQRAQTAAQQLDQQVLRYNRPQAQGQATVVDRVSVGGEMKSTQLEGCGSWSVERDGAAKEAKPSERELEGSPGIINNNNK
ncbi:hypothetical protein RJZ57_002117 [Blastomyces gilchristii]